MLPISLQDTWKYTRRCRIKQRLFKSHFILYRDYLSQQNSPGLKVLHLGCGWDKKNLNSNLDLCLIFSLDLDFDSLKRNQNRFLVQGDAATLPFLPATFDMVICEDVIEHLKNPEKVLREVNRILKPAGKFVFITPNGWSYISLSAKLTPLRFHKWYNRARGVPNIEVYRTYYRFNSINKIRRIANQTGFSVQKLVVITGNSAYFNYFKPLSRVMDSLHLLLSKSGILNRIFGISIFCILIKR